MRSTSWSICELWRIPRSGPSWRSWTTTAAVVGIATTTLRAVIGEMSVDDVLSQRERINEELRVKLDDITERWGIKVTQVEIREIEPARDIQEAMNRQMSAERLRRASVTEAEGTRQAAITVAEGEKQAEILSEPRASDSRRYSPPKAISRPPCSGPRVSAPRWIGYTRWQWE